MLDLKLIYIGLRDQNRIYDKMFDIESLMVVKMLIIIVISNGEIDINESSCVIKLRSYRQGLFCKKNFKQNKGY